MSIDSYLVIVYVASIILFLSTPGPVTILVVNTSFQHGFKSGLLTITGTNLASLVLISVSFFAIEGIFLINEQFFNIASILGAIYIMYFAFKIINSTPTEITKKEITPKKKFFINAFIIGISNPKDIIFFISFFPVFFSISDHKVFSIFLLTTIWVVLDYLILTLYSLFFIKFISKKIANIINKLSGMALFVIATYSIYYLIGKVLA